MLCALLAFDYIKRLEEGDRARRLRGRPTGTRIRRLPAPSERTR
jgi:hypothetical protein